MGVGFSPDEAGRLRRSLATFRRTGTIGTFRGHFMTGMLARGYDEGGASRCFDQIEGFGEYGFPESHAASLALLVYASAWLKCHHPTIFAGALLNSQPMGFSAPAPIVRDLREHGVEVRPVSVNHSRWDNTLEHRADRRTALRLGFCQIKGLRQEDWEWIAPPPVLECLAEGDAFGSVGLLCRDALWQARAIRGRNRCPCSIRAWMAKGARNPPSPCPG